MCRIQHRGHWLCKAEEEEAKAARVRAEEAARRADELSTYPSERSTSLRDRLRKERPPAAALECGEQARTRRFMLSNRARLILMIAPSDRGRDFISDLVGPYLVPGTVCTCMKDTDGFLIVTEVPQCFHD